jgi:hypothetical protein
LLETLGTLFYGKRASVDLIVRVIACLAEGLGIRGTAWVFEVDPNTVLQWLVEAAEQLRAFSQHFLHDLRIRKCNWTNSSPCLATRPLWSASTSPSGSTFARHRALAEQPALRPGGDPMMAGGELRATRGPMPPHGPKVFAQDGARSFAPRARLPALGWQGLEHGLRLRGRRGARLLSVTPK